jgi:hypothetical protein
MCSGAGENRRQMSLNGDSLTGATLLTSGRCLRRVSPHHDGFSTNCPMRALPARGMTRTRSMDMHYTPSRADVHDPGALVTGEPSVHQPSLVAAWA